jgi:hypothetical protein
MPENQNMSPSGNGMTDWEHIPNPRVSAAEDPRAYLDGVPEQGSSMMSRPVRYPRYIAIAAIGGFSVSVAGFALSIAILDVWPVLVLMTGLGVLYGSSVAARNLEKRVRRSGLRFWTRANWTSTSTPNLHPQADHTH